MYMKTEIDILFETDAVVVLNKPVGILVHEDGHSEGETVVEWFLSRAPSARGVGEPQTNNQGELMERSGVVHRLDKDTSGVMILAKTQIAYDHLKQQFHDQLVKKEYRALVYGPVREPWGTIATPIGRSPKDPRKRLSGKGAKGVLREAVTEWECIGTGRYLDEDFSYLKLKPKTGRTHQLRVHLKSISRAIVGDTLYAESDIARSNNLNLERMALHAHKLFITLPDGAEKAFLAPIPADLEQAIEKLEAEQEDIAED